MASSREHILDAYESLLRTSGERSATMDAVARLADVSKGGLIYHFPSKEAMEKALCERLLALVAADAERMRTSPQGAVNYYISSSYYSDSALDHALVAAARLLQNESATAQAAFATISETWLGILEAAVGDRSRALAIKLIGDGMYYQALLAGGQVPIHFTDATIAQLSHIAERIAQGGAHGTATVSTK